MSSIPSESAEYEDDFDVDDLLSDLEKSSDFMQESLGESVASAHSSNKYEDDFDNDSNDMLATSTASVPVPSGATTGNTDATNTAHDGHAVAAKRTSPPHSMETSLDGDDSGDDILAMLAARTERYERKGGIGRSLSEGVVGSGGGGVASHGRRAAGSSTTTTKPKASFLDSLLDEAEDETNKDDEQVETKANPKSEATNSDGGDSDKGGGDDGDGSDNSTDDVLAMLAARTEQYEKRPAFGVTRSLSVPASLTAATASSVSTSLPLPSLDAVTAKVQPSTLPATAVALEETPSVPTSPEPESEPERKPEPEPKVVASNIKPAIKRTSSLSSASTLNGNGITHTGSMPIITTSTSSFVSSSKPKVVGEMERGDKSAPGAIGRQTSVPSVGGMTLLTDDIDGDDVLSSRDGKISSTSTFAAKAETGDLRKQSDDSGIAPATSTTPKASALAMLTTIDDLPDWGDSMDEDQLKADIDKTDKTEQGKDDSDESDAIHESVDDDQSYERSHSGNNDDERPPSSSSVRGATRSGSGGSGGSSDGTETGARRPVGGLIDADHVRHARDLTNRRVARETVAVGWAPRTTSGTSRHDDNDAGVSGLMWSHLSTVVPQGLGQTAETISLSEAARVRDDKGWGMKRTWVPSLRGGQMAFDGVGAQQENDLIQQHGWTRSKSEQQQQRTSSPPRASRSLAVYHELETAANLGGSDRNQRKAKKGSGNIGGGGGNIGGAGVAIHYTESPDLTSANKALQLKMFELTMQLVSERALIDVDQIVDCEQDVDIDGNPRPVRDASSIIATALKEKGNTLAGSVAAKSHEGVASSIRRKPWGVGNGAKAKPAPSKRAGRGVATATATTGASGRYNGARPSSAPTRRDNDTESFKGNNDEDDEGVAVVENGGNSTTTSGATSQHHQHHRKSNRRQESDAIDAWVTDDHNSGFQNTGKLAATVQNEWLLCGACSGVANLKRRVAERLGAVATPELIYALVEDGVKELLVDPGVVDILVKQVQDKAIAHQANRRRRQVAKRPTASSSGDRDRTEDIRRSISTQRET